MIVLSKLEELCKILKMTCMWFGEYLQKYCMADMNVAANIQLIGQFLQESMRLILEENMHMGGIKVIVDNESKSGK